MVRTRRRCTCSSWGVCPTCGEIAERREAARRRIQGEDRLARARAQHAAVTRQIEQLVEVRSSIEQVIAGLHPDGAPPRRSRAAVLEDLKGAYEYAVEVGALVPTDDPADLRTFRRKPDRPTQGGHQ